METVETLKLLSEEFRYRHDLIWRLYFRAVLAVLALLSAPILYIEQLSRTIPNRNLSLLFPVLAMIVTAIASWIIYTEIKVMRGVMRAYRSIIAKELPSDIAERYLVSSKNVGETIVVTFLFAGIAMEILEVYLLQSRS